MPRNLALGETLLSTGHRAGAQFTAAMRGSFTWSRSELPGQTSPASGEENKYLKM